MNRYFAITTTPRGALRLSPRPRRQAGRVGQPSGIRQARGRLGAHARSETHVWRSLSPIARCAAHRAIAVRIADAENGYLVC